MFHKMSKRHQRKSISDRDGPASNFSRQLHAYLLSKERQKRIHALTIFGSLVKQRFVNSALFKFAGSFFKRMKQYLQTGWQQRQQYLTRLISERTSGPRGQDNEVIVEPVTVDKCPYRSQNSGCDVPPELLVLAMDINANANTRKIPVKKGRSRLSIAGPTEKPRLKQHDKRKCGKCHRSDEKCQRSKTMSHHLKRNVKPETGDKVEQLQFTEMDNQSPVVACEESTNQQAECQIHQRKLAPYLNVSELSTTDKSLCDSRTERVPLFVSGVVNETEKQVKRTRISRLKSKSVIITNEDSPKKDVRTERLETSLSLHHTARTIRPRQESKSPITVSHARQESGSSVTVSHSRQESKSSVTVSHSRQESGSSVTVSRPKVWQSNLSCNTHPESVNDWPSLSELGRRKSFIKEAATEVVKRKYAGRGFRNAGKLLIDDINVESKHSDESVDEKEPFRWTAQQKCTLNTSQRTWASVAAQSLTGSLRVTSEHIASEKQTHTSEIMDSAPVCNSEKQTHTSEIMDSAPVCNSLSVVSHSKIRKPPIRSKLAYSVKSVGDQYKIKEKPTLGKVMADRQESAKLLKALKCKNKTGKRIRQKDYSVVLGVNQDKRKPRKGERSDKANDNTTHLNTRKPNTCWQQSWTVDEMPMVYACSTPPVIVLNEQSASEGDTNREVQLPATESFSGKTNVVAAADKSNSDIDIHSEAPTDTILLSDSILSNSRDNQHDVIVIASSSSFSSSETKADITAQVKTEARSPKKVSVRYRALLRNDSSRLDAKTLTEMQTRNKKTNHLRENKVATRERQRLQRQKRQTTHHDALRFHTPTCAQDSSKTDRSGVTKSSCPYWLRSMPASMEFVQADTLGDIQSNSDKAGDDGSSEVTNMSNSDKAENDGSSMVTNMSNSDKAENDGSSEVTSMSNSDKAENDGSSEVTNMSNSDKAEDDGSSRVTCMSKMKLANLTPSRRSERLRAKSKNLIRPTDFPWCSCLGCAAKLV